MSDVFWNGLFVFLATVVVAWMQSRTKNAVTKGAGEQAVANAGLKKVADDTHTLVNSQMGAQLKLGMDLSEWKAGVTRKTEDIQAATLARQRYEEHERKQAVVDAGKA